MAMESSRKTQELFYIPELVKYVGNAIFMRINYKKFM